MVLNLSPQAVYHKRLIFRRQERRFCFQDQSGLLFSENSGYIVIFIKTVGTEFHSFFVCFTV